MVRKICVFTGGRAEYGLLKPLLDEINIDNSLELKLLVTGMHLSREFGLTYKNIEDDGFVCDEKVEMILSSDTPVSICKSMGLGMIGFSEALERIKPDILVILGDRFESMVAATAASVCRIPIAHIQGGELTLGAIDDQFRHAITKMSLLHFVSCF
jgi:UDP-hydrolysing UDP-N-acetyl-D-glucosamine 2-epimerase